MARPSTASWLDRLDRVEQRLVALAARPQPAGLTEPDLGGAERWEAGQVWAHVGEFGAFWLDELDRVLAAPDRDPPFGRVKTDARRVSAIEEGRANPVDAHLARAREAMARLRALLGRLSDADWARAGTHPTLGRMDVARQLEEFLVGHWEQHADQLDALA